MDDCSRIAIAESTGAIYQLLDGDSVVLPNGNVIQSDSQSHYLFYNVVSHVMMDGGARNHMNEASWCLLSNGCFFAVDNSGAKAGHYSPSLNQWIEDTSASPTGAQNGDNMSLLMPNGKVFIG